MNPLQSLYDGFNHGDPAGKLADLPDFPLMLDIELTSACNFRCLMCPTGNLSLKRPAGFMDVKTFEAIVSQCAGHGTAIRFIGWGEPLLHPCVMDFIRLAATAHLLTHINTNGSMVTRQMAEELARSGLASIKFSFQGVDRASYRDMRNTDFFLGMIEAITMMREARRGSRIPWISASTSITDESPEKIQAFKAALRTLVDQLNIGHTVFDYMDLGAARLSDDEIDRLKRLKGLQSVEKKHPVPCPEVYGKLSIHYDGSVRVCCNDHSAVTNLGNVMDVPLSEIWRHKTIDEYRDRLARKEYDGPLCSVCFDYMDLSTG